MAIVYMKDDAKPAVPATPAIGPRKGKGQMAREELQRLMQGLVTSAIQYTEGSLSPARAEATKLYMAEKLGNEETGRSQFVSSDVRDGIKAVIPPVIRALLGPDKAVEFVPRRADAVAQADQATDYVNWVVLEDNAGFFRAMDVLKDGLVRKLGVFKWVWDDTTATNAYREEGLTQEQLELLGSDDSLEITAVTQEANSDDGESRFTAEITKTNKDGRVRIFALPPEEFVYNREARSLDEAVFVAHVTEKTHGELIALGISEKDVKEHGSPTNSRNTNPETVQRDPGAVGAGKDEAGAANILTRYVEAYPYIDVNGDGVAELRRVCMIGDAYHVVADEPTDERPFSLFCPDPEPHTITGQSFADVVGPIQRAKTMALRGMFDSLSASIFPRTWFREGYANLADVLNTAIGAPIRVKTGANDVGEFAHSFMGKEALPVLGYLNEVIQRSTGYDNGVAGLDADSLQSSTPAAVSAAINATQAQQELLVRLFVEGAYKPLFKGVLRMLVKHKPMARMIKLRGQWVEVNPGAWDADMDVSVNVTLGMGFTEQRAQVLEGIATKQAELIEKFGPVNDLTNLKQYRDTLAELITLRGRKDPSKYFLDVDLNALMQKQAAAAQQPPPPSPEMMLAQAQMQMEQSKAQAQMQIEQIKAQAHIDLERAKAERQMAEMEQKQSREYEQRQMDFALKQREIELQDDRERDRAAAEIALKRLELEITSGMKVTQQQLDAQIERERMFTQNGPEDSAGATSDPGAAETAATPTTKRRAVAIHRDESGHIIGATIEDQTDPEVV